MSYFPGNMYIYTNIEKEFKVVVVVIIILIINEKSQTI